MRTPTNKHSASGRSTPLWGAGWRRAMTATLFAALVLAGCGDDSGTDTAAQPAQTLSPESLTLLQELRARESYSTLSDQRLESLLEKLGKTKTGNPDMPRILVPQFRDGTPELFDSDPTDVIERIRLLYGEAADRESGPAITGIESTCTRDLDGDGECDQLKIDFRCTKCGAASQVPPLFVNVADDGELAPIVGDVAERFVDDFDNNAIVLVDKSTDPLTQSAWQRIGAATAATDEAAKALPTGFACAKLPKLPKLCFLGP